MAKERLQRIGGVAGQGWRPRLAPGSGAEEQPRVARAAAQRAAGMHNGTMQQ